MVVVRKPNKCIRICLDPKNLNKYIRREHYQIPTKEDILAEMTGAKVFTKLDASHGFLANKIGPGQCEALYF